MNKPIISFVVIIISVIFVIFYVRPAYGDVKDRQNDIVSLEKILSASSGIGVLVSQTTKYLDSINEEGRLRFAVFLPEKIDVIRFANNLQHIGLSNGIILEKIKIEEATDVKQGTSEMNSETQKSFVSAMLLQDATRQVDIAKSGSSLSKRYVTTKASFEFVATYEKFQLFLYDLETSLELVDITSLSLTPKPVVVDPKNPSLTALPLYQYTINLETYSLL